MIYGDRGHIEVENINNCQGFKVYDTNYQLVKEYPVPPQISGYEYEVEACKKAIEEGRSECPEMPHKREYPYDGDHGYHPKGVGIEISHGMIWKVRIFGRD